MELQTLSAERRTGTGKGFARKLRADSQVPAVVYGQGAEAQNLVISPRALLQITRGAFGRNVVFNLVVDGEAPRMVVLKEVQVHPLKRKLLHVDMYEVREDTKLHLTVPMRYDGRSQGERIGGRLHVISKEISVFCTPLTVPEAIGIDVTPLNAGDILYVENIQFPEGVTPATRGRMPCVTVKLGRDEEGGETAA